MDRELNPPEYYADENCEECGCWSPSDRICKRCVEDHHADDERDY